MENGNGHIYKHVQDHYSNASRGDDHIYGQKVAQEFGYSAEELGNTPEESNLGLSCGNPVALANLKEGETICDLGSGAGFDVFLASKKVGSSGKAIGIDMNKDMLKKANQIKDKIGADNTSFVESPITKIALSDSSVNCVISNCVINLVPDQEKPLVFNEMYRVLKPGGRVAISDILAKSKMPPEIKNDMALYVGCIAGASQVKEYEEWLQDAGFYDILIVDAKSDLHIYLTAEGGSGSCCGGPANGTPTASSGCCGSSKSSNEAEKPTSNGTNGTNGTKNLDFNEYAGSYKIYALKR